MNHKKITVTAFTWLGSWVKRFSFRSNGVVTGNLGELSGIADIRGALDNILKCSFWLNFYLSCKKWLLIYKYKKKKFKNSFWKWRNHQFWLSLHISRDEANLYSYCCLKHGCSKTKCHNLHNVQLMFLSVQRTANKLQNFPPD